MSEFGSFNFHWDPFAFHSDELCGHHKGYLTHLNLDGSYSGDPHTRTVDGTATTSRPSVSSRCCATASGWRSRRASRRSLRANPITDGYSGLTTCVSINTAVAARFGEHRIALQPGRRGRRLQFYVDGKPARLSTEGIDLGGHRVTGVRRQRRDGGSARLRGRDRRPHHAGVLERPQRLVHERQRLEHERRRGNHGLHPAATVGCPGCATAATSARCRPTCRTGTASLYKKFADSWRVTDDTSLFVYEPGTSTKTFTDRDWPAEQASVQGEAGAPGARVPGSSRACRWTKAREICSAVTIEDLHNNCVFDVATTGDETFAEGYLLAQELRLYGTTVRLTAAEGPSRPGRMLDRRRGGSARRARQPGDHRHGDRGAVDGGPADADRRA